MKFIFADIYRQAAAISATPSGKNMYPHACSAIHQAVLAMSSDYEDTIMSLKILLMTNAVQLRYQETFKPDGYQLYDAFFGYPTEANSHFRITSLLLMAEIAEQENYVAEIT